MNRDNHDKEMLKAIKSITQSLKTIAKNTEPKVTVIDNQEALQKQIPKKPVEHSCPICNGSDIEVWQAGGYSATKFDYCPSCGQRINWTQEEDE